MSFTNKLKDRLATLSDKAEKAFIEIKVDSQVREERLAICHDCEFLLKATQTCLKCGCFVQAKTHLKGAKCPKGKW